MLIYNKIKYGLLLLMLLFIIILYNNKIEYFDTTTQTIDNNFIFKQINNPTNDYTNFQIGSINNYKNNILKIELNFTNTQTSFYLDFIDSQNILYLRLNILNSYQAIIDPSNQTSNKNIILNNLNNLNNITSSLLIKITPINSIDLTDPNYKPLVLENFSLNITPVNDPLKQNLKLSNNNTQDDQSDTNTPTYPKNSKSADVIVMLLSIIFYIYFLFKGINKFSDMETEKINNFITL